MRYFSSVELHERFSKLDLKELIKVVEYPEDYTNEARQVAAKVLRERHVTEDAKKAVAGEMMRKRIWDYLDGFSVLNDELKLPESNIFSPDEVRDIFREVFEDFKSHMDMMIPDGMKYAIAAVLG